MTGISDQIPDVPPQGEPDNLSSKAMEDAEGNAYKWEKFELHRKAEQQRIDHDQNNHPFYRWGKWIVAAFTLGYIIFLSAGLGFYVLTHKFLEASWHISGLLISGAFLSIFGLLAIMLRGMFQSEKGSDDAPLSLSEAVKALVDAFKSIKSGD